eukprot:1158856-Pelagomonas_calceolata.AAC.1
MRQNIPDFPAKKQNWPTLHIRRVPPTLALFSPSFLAQPSFQCTSTNALYSTAPLTTASLAAGEPPAQRWPLPRAWGMQRPTSRFYLRRRGGGVFSRRRGLCADVQRRTQAEILFAQGGRQRLTVEGFVLRNLKHGSSTIGSEDRTRRTLVLNQHPCSKYMDMLTNKRLTQSMFKCMLKCVPRDISTGERKAGLLMLTPKGSMHAGKIDACIQPVKIPEHACSMRAACLQKYYQVCKQHARTER